jgi:hypothetical protein
MTPQQKASKRHAVLQRRLRVAEPAAQGRTQPEIADEVGVSQPTICADLKEIHGQWRKAAEAEAADRIALGVVGWLWTSRKLPVSVGRGHHVARSRLDACTHPNLRRSERPASHLDIVGDFTLDRSGRRHVNDRRVRASRSEAGRRGKQAHHKQRNEVSHRCRLESGKRITPRLKSQSRMRTLHRSGISFMARAFPASADPQGTCELFWVDVRIRA